MNAKDKGQVVQNIIWSFIGTSLSYLVTFFLTPYITDALGVEAYGFITLAHTFTTYIDIVAVALNAFAARYIAIEYHNKRYDVANSYFSSILVANVVLVVLILIPGGLAVNRLERLINIPVNLVSDVKALFIVVLLNYCVNIFGTLYSAIAFIKNKTSITYRNKGLSSLLYLVLILLTLEFLRFKLYSMAICTLISTCLYLLMNIYYARKLIPEIVFSKSVLSVTKVKQVLGSGIWNSFNNIGAVLNNGLDLLVTNKLLDNVAMGEISIAKQISSIFHAVIVLFVNSLHPKLLEYYSKNEKEKIVDTIQVTFRITAFLTATIAGGYCLLGRSFLSMWIGSQNIDVILVIGLITFAGDVIQSNCRPVFYIFTLTDKLKWVCFFNILTGLTNFIIMVSLIKMFSVGKYAIVLSTLIAYILYSWITPFLAEKFLDVKHGEFLKSISINILFTMIECAVLFKIGNSIVLSSWKALFVYGFVFALALMIINGFIYLRRKDRESVMAVIRRR